MIQYTVEFPCPQCEHPLRIKPEYLGRKLRCKYCAHEFPTDPSDGSPTADSGLHAIEDARQVAEQRVAEMEAKLQSMQEELTQRITAQIAVEQELQEAEREHLRLQEQLQACPDQGDVGQFKQQLAAAQSERDELRTQLQALQAQAREPEPSPLPSSAVAPAGGREP